MAIAGDHVIVKMSDSGGTLRQFADGDIVSVDLGLTFDQHDITTFADATHKVVNGQLQAPVTLRGLMTTTPLIGTHTLLRGLLAVPSPVDLVVRIGQKRAAQSGRPGVIRGAMPSRVTGLSSPPMGPFSLRPPFNRQSGRNSSGRTMPAMPPR